MSTQPLITKYRPTEFSNFLGNELALKQLEEALASPSRPKAFLITGPSGIGKTTLARIIASHTKSSILEIDAASNSGVDAAHMLVDKAGFKPITALPNQMYILDECHAFSKQAWQALLKLIEEPPAHLSIALCTTELAKVPETIRTRCYPIALRTLKVQEIEDLLTTVCELEGWTVTNDTFSAIVAAADGKARKALSILQAGHSVATRDELSKIIAEVEGDNEPIIELCKFLLTGGTNWKRISTIIDRVEDEEAAMSIATRYILNAMVRGDEHQAQKAWKILEALTIPRTTYDKKVQLAAAVGKHLWGNEVF